MSSKHRRSSSSEGATISARHLRLQSTLFEEVSLLFRGELSDPLLEGVVVTMLELSPDGRQARIGFTLPPERQESGPAPVEEALERASGFIRSQLALGLDLKRVPNLRFVCVGVAPRLAAPDEEGGES
ncbi:MAG TPA: ribosome-binding factor A [Archangium sp.]|jgi:ribosome-binding factor A|uniref:ribosome-binding factor A n=1 Tax=Archangium sp. TaxID=1872627 RepID=UPI002EDACE4D